MKKILIFIMLMIYILLIGNPYKKGIEQAEEYLNNTNQKTVWFMGGAGAGFICPGCGCIAAPLTGYFFKADVPEQFSDRSDEFKTGFRKIYVSEIKKMRAKHAFAGAGIGSILSIAVISYIIYTLM